MKILVNVFHPNLKDSKINKAMMSALNGQKNITVRDVYKEYGSLKFTDTIPLEKEKSYSKSTTESFFNTQFIGTVAPHL